MSRLIILLLIPIQRRVTIDDLIVRLAIRVDQGDIGSMHIHKGFIVVVK